MKRKECPSCGMEIDEDNEICPICEYEFPQRKKSFQWIAILLAILILLWLLVL